MSAETDIGFGKKVRLSWMEKAADFSSAGVGFKDARPDLADLIRRDNSGDEAIRKILSSLRRAWFQPPEYCKDLQEEGVRLAGLLRGERERLPIHFGQVVLAYPFVGFTAETCGRLLRVQNQFKAPEVVRRVQERYGDRGFTQRCARYNVSSFIDWGLLNIEDSKFYTKPTKVQIENDSLSRWLITVLMIAVVRRDASMSEISNHPALFAFSLSEISPNLFGGSKHLSVKRLGLNQEVVSLNR